MARRISGSFSVHLEPQPGDDRPGADFLSRLTIAKTFSGPLEGVSIGQMLAARGDRDGSAGYVAIERVTGTLDGRRGSFVLQHSGHSNRGEQTLSVTVVADSGTGDLTGLTGTMAIVVHEGDHAYDFEYALPD